MGLEEEDDCMLYSLTAIPIFPLALAAVDVDGFPFTLRLAFRADNPFSRISFFSLVASFSEVYINRNTIRLNFLYVILLFLN